MLSAVIARVAYRPKDVSLPQGVEFEKHDVEITDDFRAMYDKAVDLWADIDVAIQGAKEDGALIGAEAKAVRTQQWGAPTAPTPNSPLIMTITLTLTANPDLDRNPARRQVDTARHVSTVLVLVVACSLRRSSAWRPWHDTVLPSPVNNAPRRPDCCLPPAAAHLRFFRQLCTSAKVAEVARLALEALQEGYCVVIGLQSTGAALRLLAVMACNSLLLEPRLGLSTFVLSHCSTRLAWSWVVREM